MIDQSITPAGKLFVSAAAQYKLHRLLGALAKALAHHWKGLNARQRAELLAHVGHDLPGAAAAAPVGHIDDDEAAVEVLDIAEAARGTHDHALQLAALNKRRQPRFDFIHVIHHVVEGSSLRPVDQHDEVAAVFLRGVLIGQFRCQPRCACNQQRKQGDHQPLGRQHDFQRSLVAALGAVQQPLHALANAAIVHAGLKNFGGHHRR